MKVKDIMTKQVLTLHPKEKIQDAYELCKLHDIHHLPITVHNRVVGILSFGDLLFARDIQSKLQVISPTDIQNLGFDLVESIMVSEPITVDQETHINQAVDLLIRFKINCLPVLEDGNLVGILTTYDILKCVRELTAKID